MVCSLWGSFIHGIFQARVLEWVAASFCKNHENTCVTCSESIIFQSLSPVQLFVTPWTAACQVSLSFTISWSWLKLMSIELLMPSNHLGLYCPLLLLPWIFFQHQGFFQWVDSLHEMAKYQSFSFSISPSNKYSGLISFSNDWFDLLAVQGTLKSLLNATVWRYQFFSAQPSLWSSSHICLWLLEKP